MGLTHQLYTGRNHHAAPLPTICAMLPAGDCQFWPMRSLETASFKKWEAASNRSKPRQSWPSCVFFLYGLTVNLLMSGSSLSVVWWKYSLREVPRLFRVFPREETEGSLEIFLWKTFSLWPQIWHQKLSWEASHPSVGNNLSILGTKEHFHPQPCSLTYTLSNCLSGGWNLTTLDQYRIEQATVAVNVFQCGPAVEKFKIFSSRCHVLFL